MPLTNSRPIICYVTDRKAFAVSEGIAGTLERIQMAASAGIDWIQVREKDLSTRELLGLACDAVASARRDAAARVIVNDRFDVSLAAGAAGVHLGRESVPVDEVVRWHRGRNAPEGFLVGASCHDVEQAREAASSGADYIFFGPVFETPSKRACGGPQGLERLRRVCREVPVPAIAIGGVNARNAADCIRAGAAGIAAIRLFQEATDPQALAEIMAEIHGIA
ncbi:MAG: thiamine phosphate synthase [Candidatus Acidiferrales bacterium]